MKRKEIYTILINKIMVCFTPTTEELHIIKERLDNYDDIQLQHLETNFENFGVSEVVECLYGLKF